jgi:hypothetical protein
LRSRRGVASSVLSLTAYFAIRARFFFAGAAFVTGGASVCDRA